MAKYGKWIGGGLGFVMGGPIGALLGFWIGSFFDSARIPPDRQGRFSCQPRDTGNCPHESGWESDKG